MQEMHQYRMLQQQLSLCEARLTERERDMRTLLDNHRRAHLLGAPGVPLEELDRWKAVAGIPLV